MTSTTVIRHLRNIFATHGLCETLVSNNGTPFVSTVMDQFLLANKIKHITTAPYHPATNGLAETMVQTIKDKLHKMDNTPWDIKIPNIQLGLRATPCAATNKSPAELLMNRRLHTQLDTIHPVNHRLSRENKQIAGNAKRINRETNIQQSVMYRNYGSGPRWLPGTVVNRNGPSSYDVSTENGAVVNKHIDQIIKRNQPNEVSDIQKEERMSSEVEQSVESNRNEIIEIPSQEKWAEMLGTLKDAELSHSGGKLRNRLNVHSKTPYHTPTRDNNFMA